MSDCTHDVVEAQLPGAVVIWMMASCCTTCCSGVAACYARGFLACMPCCETREGWWEGRPPVQGVGERAGSGRCWGGTNRSGAWACRLQGARLPMPLPVLCHARAYSKMLLATWQLPSTSLPTLFQLSSNSLLTPLLVFPEGRKGHPPPRASAIHIAHLIPIPRLRPPQDFAASKHSKHQTAVWLAPRAPLTDRSQHLNLLRSENQAPPPATTNMSRY
jgi:hypothetical protein